MVIGKVLDRDAFARWFGQYNSTPKYADMDWQPEEPIQIEELREALGDNVPLCRNPASRFSFIRQRARSEEHTSELQSLMRISYAVFCLKKKKKTAHNTTP